MNDSKSDSEINLINDELDLKKRNLQNHLKNDLIINQNINQKIHQKIDQKIDLKIYSSLSDAELLDHTKLLVSQERKIISQVLESLNEIDQRKLYLKRGYPSLFEFCTGYLGYSSSSAQRRISSMRLLAQLSKKDQIKIKEKLKEGKLNLTHLSQVSQTLRQKIEQRQVAQINPTMEVKNTKLSFQSEMKDQVKKEGVLLLNQIESLTTQESEKRLCSYLGFTPPKKAVVKQEGKDQIRLSVTLDQETKELLDRFKDLTAHQNPSGSIEKTLKLALKIALKQVDPKEQELKKRRKKINLNPKDQHCVIDQSDLTIKHDPIQVSLFDAPDTAAPAVESVNTQNDDLIRSQSSVKLSNGTYNFLSQNNYSKNRYIPKKLKSKIYKRDKGQCQWIDHITGRRCNATYRIQIDHVYPLSQGGKTEEENLQLLCFRHNALKGTQWL